MGEGRPFREIVYRHHPVVGVHILSNFLQNQQQLASPVALVADLAEVGQRLLRRAEFVLDLGKCVAKGNDKLAITLPEIK